MTRGSWARLVFGVTAAISLVTLGIELVYAVFGWYPGSEPDALTRVVNWFSYFTNFSNILCIVGLTMLARNPQRDGRWFRPVHLAGLVGITVTFFVYMIALRPDQVLDGIHIWTNAGYHIVVPILAVAGWLVFGPFPRSDGRSLRLTLLWVAIWAAWTLLHGALSGWYPYAIVDASKLGYPAALRTSALILLFIAGIAGLYIWVDRIRSRPSATPSTAPTLSHGRAAEPGAGSGRATPRPVVVPTARLAPLAYPSLPAERGPLPGVPRLR
jgi:hypothetical protein